MGLFRNRGWLLNRSRDAVPPEFHSFLKSEFGIRVRNGIWYVQALTHASMAGELPQGEQSNERLEFLGDSVLGAVAAELVFFRYPHQDEGPLTQKKSKLVSRKSLNRMGESMGLDRFIRSRIGRQPLPSTVVGNALEALIGAIYLDHGYQKARACVVEMFMRYGAEAIMEEAADFKSRLQHWAQMEGKDVEYFEVGDGAELAAGPDRFKVSLNIDGRTVASGEGRSKKAAEQDAAREALERGEWRENTL